MQVSIVATSQSELEISSVAQLNCEMATFSIKVQNGSQAAEVIVIQEIFGVTEHIRSVADRYAALGFVAWAPSFYDVVEKGVVLEHNDGGIQKGIQLAVKLGWDWPLETIRACARQWAGQSATPMAAVGYCWGGSLAWLASTRIEPGGALKATIGYYGSKVSDFKNETPRIPVMLHFGEEDHGIPMEKVRSVMDAQPQVPVELYKAGHGFNRDGSSSYNAEAAKLALDKTLAFLVRQGF
jgi:carboxymethylenebutenolidase